MPFFSIGSFSFSSKFLINSSFFKIDELDAFLLFFNTSLVTKRPLNLDFKLLSLKTKLISFEFFSVLFYIQPIINTLALFWFKNLMLKDKIVIKNYEMNLLLVSLLNPDFFQIKSQTIYLYIYVIKKNGEGNLLPIIFIQTLSCRIRKIKNKFDVVETIFLKLLNYFSVKELLKRSNIKPHSFCEIISLKRKSAGPSKTTDFLKFFCFQKIFKKKFDLYLSLKYTFCFIILKFFQNLFNDHIVFFLNFLGKRNCFQTKKKSNTTRQYLYLNKIIFIKHTELLHLATEEYFYEKKYVYLFYPVLKSKKNYNSRVLRTNIKLQRFTLEKTLFSKILIPKTCFLLNTPDSMQYEIVEILGKISLEKINGFLPHEINGERVKQFMIFINRILFYHIKKINNSKINLKTFFRISCYKNICDKEEYLQLKQYIFGILYNFKKHTQSIVHQKKKKPFEYQSPNHLEDIHNFFIKLHEFLIICPYINSVLELNWVYRFILKNKEIIFRLSRLYVFSEIITSISSGILNFFLDMKQYNTIQYNEKYNEYFEKNSLNSSLSRGFLSFFKKICRLFLLKSNIKTVLSYKDLFVGIFWTNFLKFKWQLAKHFNVGYKCFGYKKQLINYPYYNYLKSLSLFSSCFIFRKNGVEYLIVKNLKILIQNLPFYLYSKVFSNKKCGFKNSNEGFFGKSRYFDINII